MSRALFLRIVIISGFAVFLVGAIAGYGLRIAVAPQTTISQIDTVVTVDTVRHTKTVTQTRSQLDTIALTKVDTVKEVRRDTVYSTEEARYAFGDTTDTLSYREHITLRNNRIHSRTFSYALNVPVRTRTITKRVMAQPGAIHALYAGVGGVQEAGRPVALQLNATYARRLWSVGYGYNLTTQAHSIRAGVNVLKIKELWK